jgi:hypothetical protein
VLHRRPSVLHHRRRLPVLLRLPVRRNGRGTGGEPPRYAPRIRRHVVVWISRGIRRLHPPPNPTLSLYFGSRSVQRKRAGVSDTQTGGATRAGSYRASGVSCSSSGGRVRGGGCGGRICRGWCGGRVRRGGRCWSRGGRCRCWRWSGGEGGGDERGFRGRIRLRFGVLPHGVQQAVVQRGKFVEVQPSVVGRVRRIELSMHQLRARGGRGVLALSSSTSPRVTSRKGMCGFEPAVVSQSEGW